MSWMGARAPGANRSLSAAGALCAALVSAACGGPSTAPSNPPDPTPQVTPVESSGPVRISFVSASISPGGTVAGCGPLIEGCAGRLRMTLRLDPPSDGPILYVRIYLHATNLIACLSGESGPFPVQARTARIVEIPLDRADRCGTPTTMATMAAVVEGPIEVASRQTWSIRYVFAP
jgi:hypothetical protein